MRSPCQFHWKKKMLLFVYRIVYYIYIWCVCVCVCSHYFTSMITYEWTAQSETHPRMRKKRCQQHTDVPLLLPLRLLPLLLRVGISGRSSLKMTFQLMIAINSKQQQIRERKRYGRDEERGRETSKMHERSTVCVCACAPLLIVTGAVTSCVKWCVCDTVWFSSAALWYKYRSHSGVEISFVSSAQRESSPLFRSTEKTQFSLFFFLLVFYRNSDQPIFGL